LLNRFAFFFLGELCFKVDYSFSAGNGEMRRAVRLKRIGLVVAGLLVVTIPGTKGEAQSVSSAAASTTEYVVDTFVGPSSSSAADSDIGDVDGFRQTARVNIPNEFGFDARGNTYFTEPQVFKVKGLLDF
jgi:hypothetical protein